MTTDITGLLVSIVVCTCNPDNYSNLTAAIASLLAQTYQNKEIIVVVDGNQNLQERVLSDYGNTATVKSFLLKENHGVSGARNTGIIAARGDIIAFLDDDAVAGKAWLDNLLKTYHEFEAISVGGKILPIWTSRAPDFLPAELYWLVGVTNDGFAVDKVVEVRNTFGPNMSFKKEVFQAIGLFNQHFGFSSTSHLQAEEPELALRMQRRFGKGVLYNPEAIVYHKIPSEKIKVGGLLKRAFFQGYSKAFLNRLYASSGAITNERSYLRYLIFRCIPRRASRFYQLTELKKTVFLAASIASVGLGFGYGYLKKGKSPAA